MSFPTAITTGPQSVSSYTNASTGTLPTGATWETGVYLKITGTNVTMDSFYIPGQVVVAAGGFTLSNSIVEAGDNTTGLVRITASSVTTTITNCRISSNDSTTNNGYAGIKDDSSSGSTLHITACDIFWFEQGVYIGAGYVKNSYIHDLGFITADHNECIYLNAGSGTEITGNSLFNELSQTAAFYAVPKVTGDKNVNCTFSNNLVAGCGGSNYMMYTTTSDTGWTVEDNNFSEVYGAPHAVCSGWPTTDGTSVWSGNVWNESGTTIPAP